MRFSLFFVLVLCLIASSHGQEMSPLEREIRSDFQQRKALGLINRSSMVHPGYQLVDLYRQEIEEKRTGILSNIYQGDVLVTVEQSIKQLENKIHAILMKATGFGFSKTKKASREDAAIAVKAILTASKHAVINTPISADRIEETKHKGIIKTLSEAVGLNEVLKSLKPGAPFYQNLSDDENRRKLLAQIAVRDIFSTLHRELTPGKLNDSGNIQLARDLLRAAHKMVCLGGLMDAARQEISDALHVIAAGSLIDRTFRSSHEATYNLGKWSYLNSLPAAPFVSNAINPKDALFSYAFHMPPRFLLNSVDQKLNDVYVVLNSAYINPGENNPILFRPHPYIHRSLSHEQGHSPEGLSTSLKTSFFGSSKPGLKFGKHRENAVVRMLFKTQRERLSSELDPSPDFNIAELYPEGEFFRARLKKPQRVRLSSELDVSPSFNITETCAENEPISFFTEIQEDGKSKVVTYHLFIYQKTNPTENPFSGLMSGLEYLEVDSSFFSKGEINGLEQLVESWKKDYPILNKVFLSNFEDLILADGTAKTHRNLMHIIQSMLINDQFREQGKRLMSLMAKFTFQDDDDVYDQIRRRVATDMYLTADQYDLSDISFIRLMSEIGKEKAKTYHLQRLQPAEGS